MRSAISAFKPAALKPADAALRFLTTFAVSLFAAAVSLAASLPLAASAQIVETSNGVFQALPDKSVKIIAARSEPSGIFVLSGPPTDLQLFDPAKVPAENALHAFLGYSPELDRYTYLQAGAQRYPIKGNFTLVLSRTGEDVRLSVDNNNPLATVMVEGKGPGAKTSLLAFRGLQSVANTTDPGKLALLEANQLNPQLRGVIEPYYLTASGLTLKGNPLPPSPLGLEIAPPKNPCLNQGALFLSSEDVSAIRQLKKDEGVRELIKRLSASAPPDPLKGVLLLRIESDSMIGLRLGLGANNINIIKLVGRPSKLPICTIREIPLQE